MFHRRPIAVVVASALCVGAIATAVGAPTPRQPGSSPLQQIKMADLQQIASQRQGSSQASKTSMNSAAQPSRPGGRNQQVRPASSQEKFVAEANKTGEDVYIIRLHDLPVATYDGRVKGYAATAKSIVREQAKRQSSWSKWLNQGKSLLGLATEQKAREHAYKSYLAGKQAEAIRALRSKGVTGKVRMQFSDALNGFTMKLTQAQAKAIAALPEVAFVQRSEMLKLHTDRGPQFIGADAVWQGNTASGVEQRGEGVLVGILDSGINSDHPSFAATGADGYFVSNPLGSGNYLGDCATGVVTCNDKLIGVWSWPVITDTFGGIRPASGEDYNGHGSHTAGTTAGNVQYHVPLLGSVLGDGDGTPTGLEFPLVSGVAPRANLIAYQVCLPDGGCPTEAVVKAIDQAILDGVDVINFSIGGAERFPWQDATELAFLSAREAGISLSASAGNFGSGFYTVSHSSPWAMVVAASTHDRVLDIAPRSFSLSGGATTPPDFPSQSWTQFGGISATGITGTLVNAADFGDELCANGFAPGTFNINQIVVCKRGEVARLLKAFNVQAGGAGGFILVNAGYPDDDDAVINDTYPLPGIQLQSVDGQAMLAWMADGGTDHSATIGASVITAGINSDAGDILAEFSSRGPASTYSGHMVPHISGPGIDIFAPYADEHPFHPGAALSSDWAMSSGTSMSSPHVAGAMALLKQAHPDWTASEIQSALMMTASETVRRDVNDWNTQGHPASQYRAGAGRVDVKAAVDSGLVMDETAANFRFANPQNGGDVKQLNLPQLVNNNCRDVCSWTRVVRATRDGSWTVSTDPMVFDRWMTGEGEMQVNGAKITVTPSSFSLQAGQTAVITVRADLSDTQFARDARLHVDAAEEIELWSNVRFTANDPSIASAHWPMSINFDHGPLPKELTISVHRDQGAYRVASAVLPAMAQTAYRSFGAIKADVETLALPQDIDHVPFIDDNDLSHGNVQFALVDVPANTARLVVDVLENSATTAVELWRRGWLTVYVGIDANGNGVADYNDELLCLSNTEIELNYCSISNPDAGQYWIAFSNVRTGSSDGEDIDIIDSYRVATAVVPAQADNLQVTGPASTNGSAVALDLSWDMPELEPGDVAYAGFDVGSAAVPGKVGFVPIKFVRGVNDVSLSMSQTHARPGDLIDLQLHVVENVSGADRQFDLSTTLPAGLTLIPESVSLNKSALKNGLVVEGNTIRLTGSQRNSADWSHDYVITTSTIDASCRTPVYRSNSGSSAGGFVGMVKNLGLTPDFGGSAFDWYNDEFTIPLTYFWGKGLSLYNNDASLTYPELKVSPQGWVALDPWVGMPAVHQKFPFYSSPYTPMIGVMWKGKAIGAGTWFSQDVNALGTPLNVVWGDPEATSGMVMAQSTTTNELVFEWVNARSQQYSVSWDGAEFLGESNDRYSFNLILNPDTRFGDGEFEIMMAYGDLDFGSEDGAGSIGVHGHHGALDIFGYPFEFESGKSFAYNDLKTKLSDELVVCYDYVGPQSSQFDIRFRARVAETAAGQTLTVNTASAVSGMGNVTASAVLIVNGSLQVYPIANQSVVENTRLNGITVNYHDADDEPNLITVSGAHVSAVVHDHAPGASIDLIPETNFEGSTVVTVTVADASNPADRASTEFTLTVTKGVDVSQPAPTSSGGGGGGSLPLVSVGALVALLLLRRRQR